MYKEGLYEFDFKNCECEKFDQKGNIVHGLSAVDFVVETDTHVLFIEVKDYDTLKKKIENTEDGKEKEDLSQHYRNRIKEDLKKFRLNVHLFAEDLSRKFKDSILRKYVSGYKFEKPVIYILILEIDSDSFAAKERNELRLAIVRNIPTFSTIQPRQIEMGNFELLDIEAFSEKYNFPVCLCLEK